MAVLDWVGATFEGEPVAEATAVTSVVGVAVADAAAVADPAAAPLHNVGPGMM